MAKYELNLQDYLRILRKRKWIIFSFVVIGLCFGLFYASLIKPSYRTSTTVQMVQRETYNKLMTEMMYWNPGDVMETAATSITNYNIMKSVAQKMGLLNPEMSKAEKDAIIGSIAGDITAKQKGNTNLINITVTSNTPARALAIAEFTAESFIEDNLKTKSKQSESVRQFVETQLRYYEQALSKSEKELLAFKESLPLELRSPNVDAMITKKDDPLIAGLETKLVEQQLNLSMLLQELTEEHPAVVNLKEEINVLQNNLEREKARFFSNLKALPENEIKFTRLLRNVELNKELYIKFRDRLEEVKITQAHEVEDVKIVEPPFKPYTVGTSRKKTLFIGLLMGGLFGLIVGFLRESLDTSIGTIEDVEEYIKLPVLGVIPYIDVEQAYQGAWEFHRRKWIEKFQQWMGTYQEDMLLLQKRMIFAAKHPSLISEAYRILQTNLRFTVLDKNLKTIVFTSVGASEGKTLTSINSAISMAQMGKKVLLVDADFRRPTIYKLMGIDRENGLSDIVLGKTTLSAATRNIVDIMVGGIGSKSVLQSPGIENLHLLTCGSIPLNSPSLFGTDKMDKLIAEMHAQYDVVIFDAAPVLPVTDTLILASKCEAAILVYQSGRAARGALKRAKEQLINLDAHVVGVVLNNISASEMKPSTNYYYYGKEYVSE